MTYELYVFDTHQVADLEGAREAHEAMPYFERSRPVSDQTGRKWRTVRALQTSHRDLSLIEPDKPRRSEEEMRYAQLANLETAHALCLNVFDDAVEIVLEVPERSVDPGQVVKATFGCLMRLDMEGFGRVYDAQLDRLLDVASDETVVLRSYTAATATNGQGTAQSGSTTIGVSTDAGAGLAHPPVAPDSQGRSKPPWWRFWR